jgi:hypothetical protein
MSYNTSDIKHEVCVDGYDETEVRASPLIAAIVTMFFLILIGIHLFG